MSLLDRAAQRLLEGVRLRVRPDVAHQGPGAHRSDARAAGVEFAGHREYAPGDDARQIDWHAFARTRTLAVRTFEAERDARIFVLVDVSASMARGAPPKLDVARRLAAAFGFLGARQFDRVQVVPFADALGRAGAALRRRDQLPALEAFLAGLAPGGVTTFEAAARGFVERFPPRAYVVVVSDLMEAVDWEPGLRLLGRHGHQLCLVRVRCQEDAAPAFGGELELTDAETGATLRVTVTRALREAYGAEVAAHAARVREAIRRVGGQFVDAAVEAPFDQLLRQVVAQTVERA